MATRRCFIQEYQDQAVSLVLHSGRMIRDVAKSIGVHEITLGKWVNEVKGGGSGRDQGIVRDQARRVGTSPQRQRSPVECSRFY
jgi:transposase-like protein